MSRKYYLIRKTVRISVSPCHDVERITRWPPGQGNRIRKNPMIIEDLELISGIKCHLGGSQIAPE